MTKLSVALMCAVVAMPAGVTPVAAQRGAGRGPGAPPEGGGALQGGRAQSGCFVRWQLGRRAKGRRG